MITQMVRSTKDSLNGFTRNMNTIGNEMSNNLINGISGAVTGVAGILNEVVSKVQFTMSLCIEWLFLFVRDDPRYSPPQQKSWYTKCTEEYPEITAMLESEQRSEIIGTLRRMPQNFLFKGLPDDIKDDYKLMDF